MNGLDVAIGLSLLAAFVGGYRTGLIARAASWTGLLLGLLIAARTMRSILEVVGRQSSGRRPMEIVGVLIAAAFIGKMAGLVFGKWLQARLPTRPVRKANRFAGGALGTACVVFISWLLIPLLAQIPGWPSETARSSAVARVVHDSLPMPPDALASVRRLVRGGRFPQVVTDLRRSLDGGVPPKQVALTLTTQTEAQHSTVQISAIGCGVLANGSGFAVDDGRVVTNAHVVAGAKTITVVDADGKSHPATTIEFDPKIDLAVLQVADYHADSLLGGAVSIGDEVAVFGYPEGGSLLVRAAGIRQFVEATGRDIYDGASVKRSLIVLAGKLAPGDSGAALVNRSGKLVGMAFAVAPDRKTTAYAIPAQDVISLAAKADGSQVSTGRCLSH